MKGVKKLLLGIPALPEAHRCSRIIIRKNTEPNVEGRLEVKIKLFCEKEERIAP